MNFLTPVKEIACPGYRRSDLLLSRVSTQSGEGHGKHFSYLNSFTHCLEASSVFAKGRAYGVRERGIASYKSRDLKLGDVLKPSLLSSSLCASIVKKICNTESWQRSEDLELPYAAGGDVNWYNRYEKRLDGTQQNSIIAIPDDPVGLLWVSP